MQAIQTRFFGPTNTKPARVKAYCDAGSVWFGFHNGPGKTEREAYHLAAKQLATKLGWSGVWVGGGVRQSRDAYVFVFVGKPRADLVREVKASYSGNHSDLFFVVKP